MLAQENTTLSPKSQIDVMREFCFFHANATRRNLLCFDLWRSLLERTALRQHGIKVPQIIALFSGQISTQTIAQAACALHCTAAVFCDTDLHREYDLGLSVQGYRSPTDPRRLNDTAARVIRLLLLNGTLWNLSIGNKEPLSHGTRSPTKFQGASTIKPRVYRVFCCSTVCSGSSQKATATTQKISGTSLVGTPPVNTPRRRHSASAPDLFKMAITTSNSNITRARSGDIQPQPHTAIDTCMTTLATKTSTDISR